MKTSSVFLDDYESVRFDDTGRSAAYFCKRTPIKVDAELISELKMAAERLGSNNLRLCLHDSPGATLHEMINLEFRGNYYRPHKHRGKGESYHLIEGSMGAFVFDEDGRIIDANVLEPNNGFLYRVGEEMYHAVMPLSDLVIYHETRLGPFLNGDSLFAPWAPDGSDVLEATKYTEELRSLLGV